MYLWIYRQFGGNLNFIKMKWLKSYSREDGKKIYGEKDIWQACALIWRLHGRTHFPDSSSCWQSSIPYTYSTQLSLSLLNLGQWLSQLLDATLNSWPLFSTFKANHGSSSPSHTSNLSDLLLSLISPAYLFCCISSDSNCRHLSAFKGLIDYNGPTHIIHNEHWF